MTDTLSIQGLRLQSVIGCLDWERKIKQSLLCDVEFDADCRKIAENDDIAQAINYVALVDAITRFADESAFKLIETFADKLAIHLLQTFPLQRIKLCIAKPGAIPQAQTVAITVEREA